VCVCVCGGQLEDSSVRTDNGSVSGAIANRQKLQQFHTGNTGDNAYFAVQTVMV
jgi:hypothetical protein